MSNVRVERQGGVATVEICRGPNNYFDLELIRYLADAFDALDADPAVRSIVLCSEGRNFCAGANFSSVVENKDEAIDPRPLYLEALRLFRAETPIVAAVQGSAIGGGLGLALMADFRIAGPQSRFLANFNRLGIHPGFGLSATLPRIVGSQRAALLFYTGRRLTGEEALAWGLVDVLAEDTNLRAAAYELAGEIAGSAPLAVTATRRTLRRELVAAVTAAIEIEVREQRVHFATADFREGVSATAERRVATFTGS